MTKSIRMRRVLIASANPLFSDGLRHVYIQRWADSAEFIGVTTTVDETMKALNELRPDLVIVDFDDISINRDEFLNRFIAGHSSIKVVLVSLTEAGQVVIYDRRQLTSKQADEWLKDPWGEEKVFEDHQMKARKQT